MATEVIILAIALGICVFIIIGVCCYFNGWIYKLKQNGDDEFDPIFPTNRRDKQQMERMNSQLSQLQSQLSQLEAQLEDEKREKEDALNRLSRMMSSRLRDGNPNVVDLSDQDRPAKLGEQYSELYDNQWTDAYNAMDEIKRFHQKQIIEILLKILKNCFDVCNHQASQQMLKIQQNLKSIVSLFSKTSNSLESDLLQRLKEERKQNAKQETPSYQSVKEYFVAHEIDDGVLKSEAVQVYTRECIRICWLMVLQDPPMVLYDYGGGNAKQYYREYLQRGVNLQYIVWPSLLLHKQGPMVTKGTAEFGP